MRTGLLFRAMSSGPLTKQYVSELFHNLETGQAPDFLSRVADNVDWTIKGTHPLAGHYTSKKAFQVRLPGGQEQQSCMACTDAPMQYNNARASLLMLGHRYFEIAVSACVMCAVSRLSSRMLLQEDALAKIGAGLKEPLKLKVNSILIDGDWAAVEMSAVGAVSKKGWPFDNEYCWVCRFDQVICS